MISAKKVHYLIEGMIFVSAEEYHVITVLGSCVSVCLWDPYLKIGGMNHYIFSLWNGKGLPTPRYGNIAIPKLIKKMMHHGCKKVNIKAKVFGGASVLSQINYRENGEWMNNIILAEDMLKEEGIPIISFDVGEHFGRKIKFNTRTGVVMVKRFTTKLGMKT
jgi:chemotaxis protein CheD